MAQQTVKKSMRVKSQGNIMYLASVTIFNKKWGRMDSDLAQEDW